VRMGLEALAVSLAAVRISDGEVADIAKLNRLHAEAEGQDELRAATQELQQAMRESGVTRMAPRGMVNARTARAQASMMRALAKALVDDEDA